MMININARSTQIGKKPRPFFFIEWLGRSNIAPLALRDYFGLFNQLYLHRLRFYFGLFNQLYLHIRESELL